jgi:Pro-kumamolisin, activation domain/Bacterial Ig-like domain (group 3)
MRKVLPLCWVCVCAAVWGWMGTALGPGAEAQTTAPRPIARITAQVDERALATLKGNTNPIAQAAFDHGAAPVSMPANRLILVLKRSKQQEADLETYLEALQDPTSPSYHKFLTPAQFGQLYGVSDADLAVIETWLEGHGLKVDGVEKGRMALEISGTVGQVESTFHTSIRSYVLKEKQYWANATDPEIPAALTPVVAGIASLNSVKPRADYRRGPSGVFDPRTKSIRPSYTIGDVSQGYTIFLGPADAATIYDTPTSLNPNLSGTAYDGTGVTIALAGDSNVDVRQVANYRSTFGLSAKALQVVTDGADPGENGDAIEAYLDTEVSAGIAPNANVILYTAQDTTYEAGLFLAIQRALDDNQADILSVSFSECEAELGTSGNQYMDELWQQAAAQGIAVLVSAGDNGSAGCDNPNTEVAAQYGLQVNGLGSTPYNISVGGTDFDILYSSFPASFTSYVSATNTLANHRSALKYIPEEPWNDSTYPNTSTSVNEPLSYYNETNDIVAGGGGVSAVYPLPTWQSGFGSAAGRNLPDVSFLAGNGFYGAVWGLCTDLDTDANGNPIQDCASGATGNNFNLTGVGGTSAAAPAFAGMLALVEQKTGSRLGQADYVLYKLAQSNYSTVFHDVSAGDNSVSCASGTLNCVANSVGQYFLTGYDATTGFDNASGLGSVDVTQLANAWASAGLVATTTALQLNGGTAAFSITHGQSVTVAGTVTGSGGTPTGVMGLVDDLSPASYPGEEAIETFPLSGGAATGTTTFLPGGTYHVSAHYDGDATFAQSDSNSIQVTVAAESSTTSLTATYYDALTGNQAATPYYGFIYALDAEPYGNSASLSNPNGDATGTITFKNGTTTVGTAQLSSLGVAELLTAAVPVGMNSLTAVFPGDASFSASTSSPVTLTVQPGITSLSAPRATPTNPTLGANVTLGVTLSTDSAGAAPTGTVTFMNGGAALGTVPVSGTAGSFSFASISTASGTASFSTTSLPAGTNAINAVYSGDSDYGGTTSNVVPVTVSAPSPGISLTGTAVTISTPGTTTNNTSTITVTPQNGFTGSVALTATITSSPSGALYVPTLSFGSTSPVTISGSNSATATMTVATTAKTSSALEMPKRPGAGWMTGGAALACLLLFGIPGGEKRRRWRQLLGVVMLAAAMGLGVSSCGGGSNSSGGGGGGIAGTTPGAYTATVTGTSGTVSSQTTVTITVQ